MANDHWDAIIGAIPAVISVIAVFWTRYSSRKQINEVHLSVNSRMDQLLQTTKEAAHAEGKEEQRISGDLTKLAK